MSTQLITVEDYRTAKQIKNAAGNDSDASILMDIEAASVRIEADCHRSFGSYPAGLKTFCPSSDGAKVFIGDYSSVSRVMLNGTESDEYSLTKEPRVAHLSEFPYNYIQAKNPGVTEIEILGQPGWEEIPSAVKKCCIELVAIFRLQSSRAFHDASNSGSNPLSTTDLATQLIFNYLKTFVLDPATAEVYY